jgi:hypothetical protein
MDFRNALIPNDNLKLCCNKIDINAGYVMSSSDLAQALTETDTSFLLKFELDRFGRSFTVADEGRKFYPFYSGKYSCNINSTFQMTLPTGALLATTGIAIKLVHYNSNDVIVEESNPSHFTYLTGLTYYTARYNLNNSVIFNISEGDYIGVNVFVAEAGSINFNVAFNNTSLEIYYINT